MIGVLLYVLFIQQPKIKDQINVNCNNAVAISAMTDVWDATGNFKVGIQMDVTDTSSASNSQLLNLLIGGVSQFAVE